MKKTFLGNKLYFFLAMAVISALLHSCKSIATDPNQPEWLQKHKLSSFTAIEQSSGVELYIAPAAIYFADKTQDKLDKQAEDGIEQYSFIKNYKHSWEQSLSKKFPDNPGLPLVFSLPPPPWMCSLHLEDFQNSGKELYKGLLETELDSQQREKLQILIIFHEQQKLLSQVIRHIDTLNREEKPKLNDALKCFKAFRKLQEANSTLLQENISVELLQAALAIDNILQDFLPVIEGLTPFAVTDMFWETYEERTKESCSVEILEENELQEIKPEKRRIAATWDDLQSGINRFSSIRCRQSKKISISKTKQKQGIYLACLALPAGTEIYINEEKQSFAAEKAVLLKLPELEDNNTVYHIEFSFYSNELGNLLWAPWIMLGNRE